MYVLTNNAIMSHKEMLARSIIIIIIIIVPYIK